MTPNPCPTPHSDCNDSHNPSQRFPVRFYQPDRARLVALAVDALMSQDHDVRALLHFVQHQLDLTALELPLRARRHHPGRPPFARDVLVALWLSALIRGVTSGRELERRCREQLPFYWLCGGEAINYHTLDDFRTQHADWLEQANLQLLQQMHEEGLLDLSNDYVGQDGMRTRASAGTASFRRSETLQRLTEENDNPACPQEIADSAATPVPPQATDSAVTPVPPQAPDADTAPEPTAGQQAARERAQRERGERLLAAQQACAEVQHSKDQRRGSKNKPKPARASTTDPQARNMKMGDGGYRPAYNVQFATALTSLVMIGCLVTNIGSDMAQVEPMLQQLQEQPLPRPQGLLVDGGYGSQGNIEAAQAHSLPISCPIREQAQQHEKGVDRYAKKRRDTPAMVRWRSRMQEQASQEVSRQRPKCELVNAYCRNHGLGQFRLRGVSQVETQARWYMLAHNWQRYQSWRAQQAPARS